MTQAKHKLAAHVTSFPHPTWAGSAATRPQRLRAVNRLEGRLGTKSPGASQQVWRFVSVRGSKCDGLVTFTGEGSLAVERETRAGRRHPVPGAEALSKKWLSLASGFHVLLSCCCHCCASGCVCPREGWMWLTKTRLNSSAVRYQVTVIILRFLNESRWILWNQAASESLYGYNISVLCIYVLCPW